MPVEDEKPNAIAAAIKGGFLAHKKKSIAAALAALALLAAYLTGDADLLTTVGDVFKLFSGGEATGG